MLEYTNTNMQLRLVKQPKATVLLESINDQEAFNLFQDSQVFNRQEAGLRLSDFEKNDLLRKRFQVIATFLTEDKKDNEFIAIMEALDFPVYIITYNIEMTQFIFARMPYTSEDPIDHSAASRKHA